MKRFAKRGPPAGRRGRWAPLLALVVALFWMEGAAVAAESVPGSSVSLPLCGIEETRSGGQILLRGVALAEAGALARYRLRVVKAGSAGSSDISQGGEVRLEPGGRQHVGQVGISVEEGGRYDATLTLSVDGHSVECRASGPRSPAMPL